jgi:hypothetical protein
MIGRQLVLLCHHVNNGGFLLLPLEADNVTLAHLPIPLELFQPPLKRVEQHIQPIRNKEKKKTNSEQIEDIGKQKVTMGRRLRLTSAAFQTKGGLVSGGLLNNFKGQSKSKGEFLKFKIPAMHVLHKGLFYHTTFGQIYSGETIPLRGHEGLNTDDQCGDVCEVCRRKFMRSGRRKIEGQRSDGGGV